MSYSHPRSIRPGDLALVPLKDHFLTHLNQVGIPTPPVPQSEDHLAAYQLFTGYVPVQVRGTCRPVTISTAIAAQTIVIDQFIAFPAHHATRRIRWVDVSLPCQSIRHQLPVSQVLPLPAVKELIEEAFGMMRRWFGTEEGGDGENLGWERQTFARQFKSAWMTLVSAMNMVTMLDSRQEGTETWSDSIYLNGTTYSIGDKMLVWVNMTRGAAVEVYAQGFQAVLMDSKGDEPPSIEFMVYGTRHNPISAALSNNGQLVAPVGEIISRDYGQTIPIISVPVGLQSLEDLLVQKVPVICALRPPTYGRPSNLEEIQTQARYAFAASASGVILQAHRAAIGKRTPDLLTYTLPISSTSTSSSSPSTSSTQNEPIRISESPPPRLSTNRALPGTWDFGYFQPGAEGQNANKKEKRRLKRLARAKEDNGVSEPILAKKKQKRKKSATTSTLPLDSLSLPPATSSTTPATSSTTPVTSLTTPATSSTTPASASADTLPAAETPIAGPSSSIPQQSGSLIPKVEPGFKLGHKYKRVVDVDEVARAVAGRTRSKQKKRPRWSVGSD